MLCVFNIYNRTDGIVIDMFQPHNGGHSRAGFAAQWWQDRRHDVDRALFMTPKSFIQSGSYDYDWHLVGFAQVGFVAFECPHRLLRW